MLEIERTFVCPACGVNELALPEGWDPLNTPYVQLAELDNCDAIQSGSFVFGNGFTTGFGGRVQEMDTAGNILRERWVPPRVAISYLYYRDQVYLSHAEPESTCFPQPLFRNRVVKDGKEHIYVAMAFLPHGEIHPRDMRARGEALAKALG
ncbi:MAG: hypothetical protein O2807_00815 [bacterium]|nr:hypothetical protein [bacterium]